MMKQVIVESFGGPEQLQVRELDTPSPGADEVLVKVTSIGMNHAELMGRRGEYKISTGEPPFTPGLEAGGVIEAVGDKVDASRVGQRVIIGPDAPRLATGEGYGGTYRSHYICTAEQAVPAPDALPDEQLGAVWLSYLTAWGCLVWKHGGIQKGDIVALPAASSSVALAAAQIVKSFGGTAIGLTTSPNKVEQLTQLETAQYDHLIVTHDADRNMLPWYRDIKAMTNGQGVNLFFDPVAAGDYLSSEIRCLTKKGGGKVYVYGLLGQPGSVDVTPLIRLKASIVGWGLTEVVTAGDAIWRHEAEALLERFADGTYRQHIDATFPLDDVQHAHEQMEKGAHIGKLVLTP